MTLTQGSGPLGHSAGHANHTIDAPAHRILFQADPRRLRAFASLVTRLRAGGPGPGGGGRQARIGRRENPQNLRTVY